MFTITIETTFQASHSLILADNKPEPLHSHDWRVEVAVQAEQLDQQGLVMDFHVLESLLNQAVMPLVKTGNINQVADFSHRNPSAEAVAKYIADRLVEKLPTPISLCNTTVWETKTCRASWLPQQL